MSQRQKEIVYGYVRSNHRSIINDIIEIICSYFLTNIDSKILNDNEKCSFISLLFNKLKSQQQNQHIRSIETNLLFRLSERGNTIDEFHKYCDDKGATITIIHNHKNHIFGGYISKSWFASSNKTSYPDPKEITDPNAFLFCIRPTSKCIELKQHQSEGHSAAAVMNKYGPVFGKGRDLLTRNAGQHEFGGKGVICAGDSTSYEFNMKEMADVGFWKVSKVNEMEIFQVVMQ